MDSVSCVLLLLQTPQNTSSATNAGISMATANAHTNTDAVIKYFVFLGASTGRFQKCTTKKTATP